MSQSVKINKVISQQHQQLLKIAKGMTTIKTKLMKTGEHIFYSLVEKQSQSKIGFNTRLLILVEQKYIGYIRQKDINKKDIEASLDLTKIKKKISLKDIRRILNLGKQITLMINQYDKNNKLSSLKWLFRMESEKLADSWVQILEKQNSPFPSRKNTEQKDRENQTINKNPSIKQLVKETQNIAKQKQQMKKKNIEPEVNTGEKANFQKPKQDFKINQKPKINEQKLQNRNKQVQKKQTPRQGKKMHRQSDQTFTFKAPNSEDIDQFSPPKKQQAIANPSPVLEKIRKFESNLSNHLEQGIDKSKIQQEFVQFKKLKLQSKLQTGQFRQLQSNLTNRQKQIQIMNFYNYFRQTINQIDDRRFQDFYYFCQIKTIQLLLQNFQDQAALQKWISYTAENNGVAVTIIKTQLKQIPGNSNICDQGLLKGYLNREKNANYIWKVISQSPQLSSVFYIPMSCVVEYQGVVANFTCLFNQFQQNVGSERKSLDLSNYFEELSELTRISKLTLQNKSMIKFTKISPLSFAISEINEYLPRIISTNCQIRPQMFSQIQRIDSNNVYSMKASRKEEEQQHRYFRSPIEDSINQLAKNFDLLDQYVLHPRQLSQLMHSYGLNMVYLYEIYKKVSNSFMKGIIKTEVALRSFKVIYRKKMQQMLLNVQDSDEQNRNQETLLKTTKSLLNILLGIREQGSALWDIVTLHSQINFKLVVERQQINKGYLLLGLETQLNLKVSTNYSSCEKIFNVDMFINEVRFVPKVKPCQVYWIDEQNYSLPIQKMAANLMNSLNLKNQSLPFYIYKQKQVLDKIFEILSLSYPPNSGQMKFVPLYKDSENTSQNTLSYYRRKLSEIKWIIKAQQQNISLIQMEKIENKLDQIKSEIKFFFGLYHPFYTEIYDLLISTYESLRNYQKAQQYSKQSFANTLQLCSGNNMHLRLANNYYQKGDFYQNWGKVQESIINFRKVKNILQFNQFTSTKQFGLIGVKLAQLYLTKQKDDESIRMLINSLAIFFSLAGLKVENKQQNNKTNNLTQKVSTNEQAEMYNQIAGCLELINRCSESSVPQKKQIIIQHCLTILEQCLEPLESLNQLQIPDSLAIRLVKMLVQNFFLIHNGEITKQFFSFAENICDSLNVASSKVADPNASLDYIKDLIINKVFIENLSGFDQKAKQYKNETNKSIRILKQGMNKKLENFQHLIRSIIILLGEAFLLGILNDSHK